jgi:hypothetical protein
MNNCAIGGGALAAHAALRHHYPWHIEHEQKLVHTVSFSFCLCHSSGRGLMYDHCAWNVAGELHHCLSTWGHTLHSENIILGQMDIRSSPVVLSHEPILFWWIIEVCVHSDSFSLCFLCLLLMAIACRYHVTTLLKIAFSWKWQAVCDSMNSVIGCQKIATINIFWA